MKTSTTKKPIASRLACLSAILMSATVLVATANSAQARGHGGHNDWAAHSGGNDHFVNTIHPIIAKRGNGNVRRHTNNGNLSNLNTINLINATRGHGNRSSMRSTRGNMRDGRRNRTANSAGNGRFVNTIHPIIAKQGTTNKGVTRKRDANLETKGATDKGVITLRQGATKTCANCLKSVARGGSRPPHDPAGNTHPTVPPSKTVGMLPPHDPVGNTHPTVPGKAAGNNSVTVSNGVSKVDLSNTPTGLIVSSNSPGTITVYNGQTSQTFRGGSVTLHGAGVKSDAVNVQTPGLQYVKLANGDYSIALKPGASMPSSPPMPAKPPAQPSGGVVTGEGPGIARGVAQSVVATVGVTLAAPGAAIYETTQVVRGIVTGHPIKYAKEGIKNVGVAIEAGVDWIGGWF